MRRPLYGWLAAEGVSLVGTRVSMVALPFFVLTTTGSPVKTGLVALAEMLPLVLFKVLGGPIIDRVGTRRVALTCDWGSLLVVGSIPLLHEAGMLSFPAFLGLVAVAGALRGPGDAAKHAMTPTLAATAGVPMERVTGLSSTVERTASMLGAAVAGGLVALIGPANALVVDALSFGLSALLLAWAIPATTRPVAPEDRRGPDAVPRPAARGLAVPAQRPRPGRDHRDGGPDQPHRRGVVGGAGPGVGDRAAGAARPRSARCSRPSPAPPRSAPWSRPAYAERLPRYATYLVCFLVTGLPRFVVMAFETTPLWIVLAFCVVGGFASGFLNPILGAVIYERVPDHLMGRVSSLSTACCFALMPLGGLVGGFLVGGLGLTAAMLICGVAYFVVTMFPALDPRWREIDRRPERLPEPARAG